MIYVIRHLHHIWPDFDEGSNSNNTTDLSSVKFTIPNKYIWPLIIVIGVVGNCINLVVLSSKELKMTARGNKVSQRSKYMFSYMKGLAYTDLVYLLMTIQVCIFTIMGYFRLTNTKDLPTKAMGEYVWNWMNVFDNGFAMSSDFIVMVMTTVRFRILNNVEQWGNLTSKRDWKPKWSILGAIFFGILVNMPFAFAFDIDVCPEHLNAQYDVHCWTAVPSKNTKTYLWQFYAFSFLLVQIIPMITILVLNIWMFTKMRDVLRRRRELRRPIETISYVSDPKKPSLNFLSLPMQRIDENTSEMGSNERKSSSSGSSKSILGSKNRESVRQFKLNGLLIVLAFFHCVTTLPAIISNAIFTISSDTWLDYEGRSTYSSIANTLFIINYSKNFYLYCLVHEDIRRIALLKIKLLFTENEFRIF